jgi:hypothetical protein
MPDEVPHRKKNARGGLRRNNFVKLAGDAAFFA